MKKLKSLRDEYHRQIGEQIVTREVCDYWGPLLLPANQPGTREAIGIRLQIRLVCDLAGGYRG